MRRTLEAVIRVRFSTVSPFGRWEVAQQLADRLKRQHFDTDFATSVDEIEIEDVRE